MRLTAGPFFRSLLVVASAFSMAGGVAFAPQEIRAFAPDPALQKSSKRSVWDGVYTDDQAKRGENQYTRNCEACHGADLSGNPVDEVPALVFDAFLTQWSDRSVKTLFDAIKRSMPRDNPGGLNARAYVDIIAYVLQTNKMPSGTRELSLNPEALEQIVISKSRP